MRKSRAGFKKQKKRLSQTHEELNYLKSIVEHTEDAIVGLDLEGTVLSWNPAAEKLYGFSGDEALGSSVFMMIPPYNSDEISLILAWIKNGERITHYETLRRRKDGPWLIFPSVFPPSRMPGVGW
nr:PAS domain S-box protein [Methanobacterium formicicum]